MELPLLLKDLRLRIDHAALQPEVTEADIRRLCEEGRSYRFHSVAVNPVWVSVAAEQLSGSGVQIVSVAGFPLGAHRTDIKVAEAVESVQDGAHEIDMVTNIGWLCSDRFVDVEAEVRKVRRNLPPEVTLKVIIETNKLTRAQQIGATQAVLDGGAQYVKTGTGFFGPAQVEHVRTLSEAGAKMIAVKASGGIKTVADCLRMLEAGASRLGSSSSVLILNELNKLYGTGPAAS